MVTLNYARTVEQRVNELLSQGNIAAAQRQAENITGGGPGVQNAANRISAAIGAATDQARRVEDASRPAPQQEQQQQQQQDQGETEQDRYYRNLAAQDAERDRQAREGAKAFLRNILSQFGLGELAGNVESLIGEWGANTEVIAERLRQTEQYRERFKGMTRLQAKGVTDIRNEAEYIELESNYRQVFRDAGLQSFLGDAGSKKELDAIADLVGNYSVSVAEVRDRVTDAQRVVADAPQSVRSAFQQYYNVDPSTLVQYVLDPVRTSAEINRKANAAIVGGLAAQQGLTFGAGVAERIGDYASGGLGADLSGSQIQPQLTSIAETQRATGRLAALEGSILSDEETALAQLDLDIEAGEKVRGLQSRERARFGGQAGLSSRSLSRSSGV